MGHRMEGEEPEEEEMEGEGEGMEGSWMHHKECGCPFCMWMKKMKKMAMMGGMMPGMGMGMGMPWMKHIMGGGMGMGEGMGWRKFMSSEEKIAKLEEYLKQLQMEEKAVQEKIDHIRSKYGSA